MGLQTRPLAARIAAVGAKAAPLTGRARIIDCYARAFDRARAAKMVCYHDRENDTYAVPSISTPGTYYTVQHNGGSDWANLSCSCKGGNQPACQHRAVVAYARRNHISAVKPLPRCPGCDDRFCGGGCPETETPVAVEPCETPYEAPAGEDVMWEAEQARYQDERSPESYFVEAEYYDQLQQERDGANALQDAVMSGADPTYCVHGEPGHCIRCARLANDPCHARHRALTAQRVAVARAAINPANPLSDLFL